MVVFFDQPLAVIRLNVIDKVNEEVNGEVSMKGVVVMAIVAALAKM